jgi:hypothetical protein
MWREWPRKVPSLSLAKAGTRGPSQATGTAGLTLTRVSFAIAL